MELIQMLSILQCYKKIATFSQQIATNLIILSSCLLVLVTLTSCQKPQINRLEAIKKSGKLRIATRNSPTTYYIEKESGAGIEYELASNFAKKLNVKPVFIAYETVTDIFAALDSGLVDIAAAGLTVTEERKKYYSFAPPYQEVSSKLVFKQGQFWPRDITQLKGTLHVGANTSHAGQLLQLKKEHSELRWSETDEHSQEELLHMVKDGIIDYTIADSLELDLHRRYHADLAIAFTVGPPQTLAWALNKDNDHSLFSEVVNFFGEQQEGGQIAELMEHYYGHINKFDYVGTKKFLKAAQSTLKTYKNLFREYAEEDLDWRLLAAMSYQESHWNPKAKSHTGVRGLMMLTQRTAKQLGVTSRIDPEQSIMGGAKYFRQLLKRIPKSIEHPDKTWFALAAYNVGWGHVKDARKITKQQGGDPNKWVDVKERLPLLSQKRFYKKTAFGYARGQEPVNYVVNIRRYHDVLVWLDEEQPQNIELEQRETKLAENKEFKPETTSSEKISKSNSKKGPGIEISGE